MAKMKNAKPPRIVIRSAVGAFQEVLDHPGVYHVISIRDSGGNERYPVDCALKECRGIIRLQFDDLDDEDYDRLGSDVGFIYPSASHVQQALDFAKDKEALLVHCSAGVSRSSAMAYVIACSRVAPQDALRVLDSKYHWPNDRVVRLGAEVLGDPEIERAVKEWMAAKHPSFLPTSGSSRNALVGSIIRP